MEALLAFLDHVHSMLTTTYHNTPIMLMASPQWTRLDCEAIAQYIFEKTRTPALCMIHSGLATQYGLKWPNMTVIDIGYQKVDVTAIHDGRVVNHMDLGTPNGDGLISGGEVFTQRLLGLLRARGFSRDMAEQLKRSAICEVLPYAPAEDGLVELPKETAAAPDVPPKAPAVVDGGGGGGGGHNDDNKGNGSGGGGGDDDDDDDGLDKSGDDDGVLDVAAIVTSGQTKEFLAKKEKEKGKQGRKAKDKEGGEPAPAKTARLPNAKRTHNTFFYEEIVQEEVPREQPKPSAAQEPAEKPAEEQPVAAAAANGEVKHETDEEAAAARQPTRTEAPPAPDTSNDTPELRPKRIRRDMEVGPERFTFAGRDEIDRIVSTIYRTIQGIDDMYMRPACWDNLVFVGNGARLRGLRDNILQTLTARHLVSSSSPAGACT